jgi:ABC-type uncharacterized transport system substrate-binding protein
MLRAILFASLFAFVRPVDAHPHIFIDTGFTVFTDETGKMTHIEVTWAYDAFYSLLVTQNYDMDPDGDAVLTEEEKTKLNGFDMAWVGGFNGDLVVQLNGRELKLSGPRDFTTDMVEGRVITTHLRDLATPKLLGGSVLAVVPFDPTYYSAYDVSYPVKVEGGAICEVHKVTPELNDQLKDLRDQLSLLAPSDDPLDAGLPNAGGSFATRIEVTCSAD